MRISDWSVDVCSSDLEGQGTPQYVVSVTGAKQYRLSDRARRTMDPVAEDTQLFQVVRIDDDTLRYEARTATGRLYDAFSLRSGDDGARRLVEHVEGRIEDRKCSRAAPRKGRTDRCWEGSGLPWTKSHCSEHCPRVGPGDRKS